MKIWECRKLELEILTWRYIRNGSTRLQKTCADIGNCLVSMEVDNWWRLGFWSQCVAKKYKEGEFYDDLRLGYVREEVKIVYVFVKVAIVMEFSNFWRRTWNEKAKRYTDQHVLLLRGKESRETEEVTFAVITVPRDTLEDNLNEICCLKLNMVIECKVFEIWSSKNQSTRVCCLQINRHEMDHRTISQKIYLCRVQSWARWIEIYKGSVFNFQANKKLIMK